MSTVKSVRIRRIRCIKGAPMGRAAVPMEHLGHDSLIDHKPIALSFDKDARFLRVDLESGQFELVPLSNVAAILCDHGDEPAA